MHPLLAAEALAAKVVPDLAAYTEIKPEVAYGQASRVDFRLRGEGLPDAYVEVKNCHLSRTPGLAEFPDCKAERSARHMEELAASVRDGHRAVVIITVQRQDCDRFAAAADLDPGFARAFHAAIAAGVEVQPWVCAMTTEGVTRSHRIALS
jgi:sugar fermentation stimulation protein A